MNADRLLSWDAELLRAHTRLRAALEVTRETVERGADATAVDSDLALFCIGFCSALDGHHLSEDRTLFPTLRDENPELSEVIDKLMQDHSMLAHLLGGLRAAVEQQ